MSDRILSLKGNVFATNATTAIPANPVTGVSYRNANITGDTIKQGWPFNTIVNSAQFNQTLFEQSGLLNEIEQTGILKWSQFTKYPVNGVCRDDADNKYYEAIVESGPGSSVNAPKRPSENLGTFWKKASIGAGGYEVVWATTNTNAESGQLIFANSGCTVTLPTTAIYTGDKIKVCSGSQVINSSKVIVSGSITAFGNSYTALEITERYCTVELVYNGSTWDVLAPVCSEYYIGWTKRNIFDCFYSLLPTPPEGAFSLEDGILILSCNTAYPDFWEICVAKKGDGTNGTIRCLTEEQWQAEVTQYGSCGAFVVDTVSKSVRLPKIRTFIEPTGTGTAGQYYDETLPNIQGQFNSGDTKCLNNIMIDGVEKQNPFYEGEVASTTVSPEGGYRDTYTWFDASRYNSVYGENNPVHPASIKLHLYIQVYAAYQNVSNAVLTEIQQSLSDQIQEVAELKSGISDIIDSGNGVVEYYMKQDGSAWYRRYRNGWIEQGGYVTFLLTGGTDSVTRVAMNLLWPMATSYYSVFASSTYVRGNVINGLEIGIGNRTTTNFTIALEQYSSTSTQQYLFWSVCGFCNTSSTPNV